MATDPWGIDDGYEDALGKWHRTGDSTRAAILKTMGVDPSLPASPPEIAVRIMCPGQILALDGPAELILEDGTTMPARGRLPPDLPFGYHRLHPLDGKHPILIIVSPGRCYLPRNLRVWGWAVQLFSLRSAQSWGMGDFADLRRLARWSAEKLSAGILVLNPLCAATPGIPQNPSPYFPSSRLYRNLLYLRIEEVPGAEEIRVDLERLSSMGRALNQERYIDRNSIFRLKLQALELLWSWFYGEKAFDRYCAEEGEDLSRFATFSALAERYGMKWTQWPVGYRHPGSAAVRRFSRENKDRIRFHQWLQWLLDQQLARAVEELPIMQDLPIGIDPEGADAWAWQHMLAAGATVGAPPDEYNTLGQNWNLLPFVPYKLRAAAYEPFRRTIRTALRHARGLRIDHVMGLFRLYWIPQGADASLGAYVRYPSEDLLAIVALESHRTKAIIVGEDLGTVERVMKEQLFKHRILSYRLVWFEKEPPASYPELSLAAVTTHDLPTIAGLWSGYDLERQQELGLNPNEKGMREIRRRLAAMTGTQAAGKTAEVVVRTHRLLAKAPSMVAIAALEDALAVKERPNMPNTTGEWPNWSIPLPLSLEEIESHLLVRRVAKVLQKKRGGFLRPQSYPSAGQNWKKVGEKSQKNQRPK
jgi:4-alpha-glucanotransferase